jgi:hypothetical protein
MAIQRIPLQISHPEIAAEAFGWNTAEFTYGSGTLQQWKCKAGHVWRARINSRTLGGNRCGVCNSLQVTHPEISAEANGWDPSTVTAGSEKVVDWQCVNGHKWRSSIGQRTNKGTGCRVCKASWPTIGINDLMTTDPEIAAQAFGWDPRDFKRGSSKKMSWRCPAGHIFTASIKSRVNGRLRMNKMGIKIRYKSKCPVCTNKKIIPGLNDLQTSNPEIAVEAFGWDPSGVFAGSDKKKIFKCPEGHKYETKLQSRLQGHGCPTCSASGFKKDKQGWIYLLEHKQYEYLQIGITNNPDKRLKNHFAQDWELLDLLGPITGTRAARIERQILDALKTKGAEFEISHVMNKFAGFSECWSKLSFPAQRIEELMSELEVKT